MSDFALANIGVISNIIGAMGFLGLTVFLLIGWRGRGRGAVLALTCAVNTVWCVFIVLGLLHEASAGTLILAEIVRDGAWLSFVVWMLPKRQPGRFRIDLRTFAYAMPIGLGTFFVLRIATDWLPAFGGDLFVFVAGATIMSLWILILLEQLFRNAGTESRWALKYICLALGALFVYDFFMYSYSLLGQHIPPALWNARGALNALVVPLIAVSAARHRAWSLDVHLSRQAVFHTGALIGCGGYLLVMAFGGYFVRTLGGSWGEFLRVLFFATSILLLLIVLLSGTFRARSKVFVSKHFFSYKYDYREEWLGLTHRLNQATDTTDPYQRSIKAVAHILDSPAGALWLLRDDSYVCVANWNMSEAVKVLAPNEPLVAFLSEYYWIVDISEYERNRPHYGDLSLPGWLLDIPRARLVLPLLHENVLLGFILLATPRAQNHLTWEDLDLLKTIGRQVGGFLGQQESNQALAQARQFEAVNRFTAFLMHDLKNIAAQQSLVVQNAHKHKANPEFIEDMIGTVDSSVKRMKALLKQLQQPAPDSDNKRRTEVGHILEEVIEQLHPAQPVPRLRVRDEHIFVTLDPERFATILSHVARNAQDAVGPDGRVDIDAYSDGAGVHIEIADNGVGMDAAFIRDSLFRPFYSTKASRGMGIGAYQAREFVRVSGGDVRVTSEPGNGTIFSIILPPAAAPEATSGQPSCEGNTA